MEMIEQRRADLPREGLNEDTLLESAGVVVAAVEGLIVPVDMVVEGLVPITDIRVPAPIVGTMKKTKIPIADIADIANAAADTTTTTTIIAIDIALIVLVRKIDVIIINSFQFIYIYIH